MNDLEHGLRELLERKAAASGTPSMPDARLLRRARRRQAATVLGSVAAVVVAIIVVVAGVQWVSGHERRTPAGEPTVTTTINGVSITHPGSWRIIDPDAAGLNGPQPGPNVPRLILAVSPTDPGDAFGCPRLAQGRAPTFLFTVQEEPLALSGAASTSWPVELEPMNVGTSESGCYPGWSFLRAGWTSSGRTFEARVGTAPELSNADRAALMSAFASMTFGPARGGPGAVTIATGEEGGESWTLTISRSDPGWGWRFAWEGGSAGGGWMSAPGEDGFGGGIAGGASIEYPSGDTSRPPLPLQITGVVSGRATRVEYRVLGGPTLEAELHDLPYDTFDRPAKAFVVFVPPDTVVNAGDLVAYDATGAEVGRTSIDFSAVWLGPKVLNEATPDQLAAMRALQLAGGVARIYYGEHGSSFEGLDPSSASTISDGVAYNTSPTAIPGEVSLRVAGPDAMVMATATPDGQIYSVCFDHGPGGAYGHNDTSDPSACSNEPWP